MRDRHRIAAPRALLSRGASRKSGEAFAIQRRRHDTRCAGPRATRPARRARARGRGRRRDGARGIRRTARAPTPSSVGSSWIMRVRMPSSPPRSALPPSPCSRSGSGNRPCRRPLRRSCFAMKWAAARAATRRGSSIRIFCPRPATARRAAPAVPAWSCRRPAAPPAPGADALPAFRWMRGSSSDRSESVRGRVRAIHAPQSNRRGCAGMLR